MEIVFPKFIKDGEEHSHYILRIIKNLTNCTNSNEPTDQQ